MSARNPCRLALPQQIPAPLPRSVLRVVKKKCEPSRLKRCAHLVTLAVDATEPNVCRSVACARRPQIGANLHTRAPSASAGTDAHDDPYGQWRMTASMSSRRMSDSTRPSIRSLTPFGRDYNSIKTYGRTRRFFFLFLLSIFAAVPFRSSSLSLSFWPCAFRYFARQ